MNVIKTDNRVVVDIGTHTIKAGFIGSDTPELVVKTSDILYPVKPRYIHDMAPSDIEKILSYIFTEMQLSDFVELVFVVPAYDLTEVSTLSTSYRDSESFLLRNMSSSSNFLRSSISSNPNEKKVAGSILNTSKVDKMCEPLANVLALSSVDSIATLSKSNNNNYSSQLNQNGIKKSVALSQIINQKGGVLENNTCIKVKQLRRNLAEIAFKFGSSKVGFITDANAALYAYGRTSGIVVSVSHSAVKCTAIYESTPFYSSATVELGGDAVTRKLLNLIRRRGILLNGRPDYLATEESKECFSYVSLNYEGELGQCETIENAKNGVYLSTTSEQSLTNSNKFSESLYGRNAAFPGGKIISLGKERFMAPEILFDQQNDTNLPRIVALALTNGVLKAFGELLNFDKNIVVTGGGSMILNFAKRLENELNGSDFELDSENAILLNALPARMYAEYIGAVAAAKTNSFSKCMISSTEQLERTATIL